MQYDCIPEQPLRMGARPPVWLKTSKSNYQLISKNFLKFVKHAVFITNIQTLMPIRTTCRVAYFLRTWDGLWLRSIQTWKPKEPQLTWLTWNWIRSSCFKRSKSWYLSVNYYSFLFFVFRHYLWMMPLLTFVIPTIIPWYLTGESISNSWYFGTMTRYCISLHSTWLVNSAAHVWGSKPYDR